MFRPWFNYRLGMMYGMILLFCDVSKLTLIVTYVSGQLIPPVFKCQAFQDGGIDVVRER
jgi:hypothetical protein